jgi:isoleucyl-tRNA synthetase
VTLPCPDCGATARRVPEVTDSWYDAGALPFAQFGYPQHGEQEVAASYPAQLACADAGQASTWLPALLTVGTLALGRPPFKHAACPGPVADAQGQAMSRGRGNVQDPLALLDHCGADAVRWFLAAERPAGAPREVSAGALDEIVRTVLLAYWDCVSLAARHPGPAGGLGGDPAGEQAGTAAGRPVLDRWLLSEVAAVTGEVTAALEALDTAAAGRRIAVLIDGLAHWYLRLARQRLQDGPATPDGASAAAALRTAVAALTRLMAPLAPFLTDYAWGVLGGVPDSVHLAAWPAADARLADPGLRAQMALARRLTDLGQAARASAGAGPDERPLHRALVSAAGFADLPDEVREHVRAGLNVTALDLLPPGTALPRQGWAVAAAGEETVALVIAGGPGGG